MRALVVILIFLLVVLQYKLWISPNGISKTWHLEKTIAAQNKENKKLRNRNAIVDADIKDLKQGNDAIEECARSELGMIKKGEVFYQIVK